jgi:hypothetical protein
MEERGRVTRRRSPLSTRMFWNMKYVGVVVLTKCDPPPPTYSFQRR